MDLFILDHGIIIECNFASKNKLEDIVESTSNIDFIAGYKIGAELAVNSNISDLVKIIRKFTNLPIIYDHQKFGADDPSFCGGSFLKTLKDSGVDALIIFPHGGIESLKAAISKCIDTGLIPIIGGDMVHKGYTSEQHGYLDTSAPQKMYIDGANFGAKYFVIPCTRLDRMKIYCHRLGSMVNDPVLFITGVGIEARSDLVKACEIVKQYRSYAIIGKEITEANDYGKASRKIWEKMPVSAN